MSNNNSNTNSGMGAATIIGAAASVLGAGASVASGMKSLKKQKKLLNYQNEINNANYDKMLKDSRDYEAIVKAAQKAGINPLVALGQSAGAGSIQGASVPAESNLPSTIASASGSVASSLSNLDLIGKQKELLEEQIEAQSIENQKERNELGDQPDEISHRKEMRKYESQLARANAEMADYNASIAKIDADNYGEVCSTNLKLMKKQYDVLDQEYQKGLIDAKYYKDEKQMILLNSFADVLVKSWQMKDIKEKIQHNKNLLTLLRNEDKRDEKSLTQSIVEFFVSLKSNSEQFEKSLDEQVRHNEVTEAETKRHNKASEEMQAYGLMLGALSNL